MGKKLPLNKFINANFLDKNDPIYFLLQESQLQEFAENNFNRKLSKDELEGVFYSLIENCIEEQSNLMYSAISTFLNERDANS